MMPVPEQEALFKSIREKHPRWTASFRSGYVHGASDAEWRKLPHPTWIGGRDKYALGYLVGFAVCRGPDSTTATWFDPDILSPLVEEALGHKAP